MGRHEEVEKAKAGDKCLFTGTLIVVPDISRGRMPGPKSAGFKRAGGTTTEGNDVLGQSKDYSYKMCFLACSVQPIGVKVHLTITKMTYLVWPHQRGRR